MIDKLLSYYPRIRQLPYYTKLHKVTALSALTPMLRAWQHLQLASGEIGSPSTHHPGSMKAGADVHVRAPNFASLLRWVLLPARCKSFA